MFNEVEVCYKLPPCFRGFINAAPKNFAVHLLILAYNNGTALTGCVLKKCRFIYCKNSSGYNSVTHLYRGVSLVNGISLQVF